MPNPNKQAVKYCTKALTVSANVFNDFTAWLSEEPDLSDEDRDALANSLQSAADTFSWLAMDVRTGDDETISTEGVTKITEAKPEYDPQQGELSREELPDELSKLWHRLHQALCDAKAIDHFNPHPKNTAILQVLMAAKTAIEPIIPKPPADTSPF